MNPSPSVRELARRHRALLRCRAPWDAAWQSLADHFLPTRCRLRQQGQEDQEGPMLNSGLVDATGILAMRTLAAGLQGGLTSPARPWFRLGLDDADLARSRPGQAWLDEVATRMRAVSYGDTRPLKPGIDEQSRAMNRRVEFFFHRPEVMSYSVVY